MSTRRITTTTSVELPNPFPGISTGWNPKPYIPSTPTTKSEIKITKGQKAGTNGSWVTMIVDESGSMSSHYDATTSGYGEFLNSQKKDGIKTDITLITFEDGYVRTPYNMVGIEKAPPLTRENYNPNGMTNLLDAIGYTIEKIDAQLKSINKAERPAVVVVIQTDGHENASKKYDNETIKALISKREERGWVFMFLGANIDAFSTGAKFGMRRANTASYAMNSIGDTFALMSHTVTRAKSAKLGGMSTEDYYGGGVFTSEERAAMVGDKQSK